MSHKGASKDLPPSHMEAVRRCEVECAEQCPQSFCCSSSFPQGTFSAGTFRQGTLQAFIYTDGCGAAGLRTHSTGGLKLIMSNCSVLRPSILRSPGENFKKHNGHVSPLRAAPFKEPSRLQQMLMFSSVKRLNRIKYGRFH